MTGKRFAEQGGEIFRIFIGHAHSRQISRHAIPFRGILLRRKCDARKKKRSVPAALAI